MNQNTQDTNLTNDRRWLHCEDICHNVSDERGEFLVVSLRRPENAPQVRSTAELFRWAIDKSMVEWDKDTKSEEEPAAPLHDQPHDHFNGDDAHLVRSIRALLALDSADSLVPHGVGGLARACLAAAACRLEARAIDDHGVAMLVNQLRDVAIEFHGTQQLRARISGLVLPFIQAARAAAIRGALRSSEALQLLDYVLQDDIHNRLTPRVIDIAYTAFMRAKDRNTDDGGATDWFNDTRPAIIEAINKLRNELFTAISDANEANEAPALDVDALAQEIRRVDGSHSLGATQLADALLPFINNRPIKPRHPTVVRWRNDGIEACAGIADHYQQPQAASDMRAMLTTMPAIPAEEARLRRMLCSAQAGTKAYMDDGEAQDNRVHPSIDYLRDSVDEIERKLRERAAAAPFNAATEDQIAAVMLLTGTEAQQLEALAHFNKRLQNEQSR